MFDFPMSLLMVFVSGYVFKRYTLKNGVALIFCLYVFTTLNCGGHTDKVIKLNRTFSFSEIELEIMGV